MTTPTIPLPEPVGFVDSDGDFHGRLPQDGKTYSSDQLLEYAAALRAELEAEVSRLREALTELVAAWDAPPPTTNDQTTYGEGRAMQLVYDGRIDRAWDAARAALKEQERR